MRSNTQSNKQKVKCLRQSTETHSNFTSTKNQKVMEVALMINKAAKISKSKSKSKNFKSVEPIKTIFLNCEKPTQNKQRKPSGNNLQKYFTGSQSKINLHKRSKTENSLFHENIFAFANECDLSMLKEQNGSKGRKASPFATNKKVKSSKLLTSQLGCTSSKTLQSKSNSSKSFSKAHGGQNKHRKDLKGSTNPENNQKYLNGIGAGIHSIKSKFNKKSNHQRNSSQNMMTLSNLSKILHESEENRVAFEQRQVKKLELFKIINKKLTDFEDLICTHQAVKTNNQQQFLNENPHDFSFVDVVDFQSLQKRHRSKENFHKKQSVHRSTRFSSKTDIQTECKISLQEIGGRLSELTELIGVQEQLSNSVINTSRTFQELEKPQSLLPNCEKNDRLMLLHLTQQYHRTLEATFSGRVQTNDILKKEQKWGEHQKNQKETEKNKKLKRVIETLMDRNNRYQRGLNKIAKSGIDIQRYFE